MQDIISFQRLSGSRSVGATACKEVLMRKIVFVLVVLFVSMSFSCSTLLDIATRPLTNQIEGSLKKGASDAAAATADFKEGEVLAGLSESAEYLSLQVAVVKTNASTATKNQAEVIYVSSGKTDWANYIVKSRQATKDDIKIGAQVLFLYGWDGYDMVDPDNYRKNTWSVGTVTNSDELFKGFVEVNGNKYGIKLIRIPSIPIK
jgi:hypothetical protein